MGQPVPPGWAWDQASGRWVPAAVPAEQPGGYPPQQRVPAGQPPAQQWALPQHVPPYAPPPAAPYGPQHAPPPVPAGPPGPAGPTLGEHLRRAFSWNVSAIAVSPREHAQLNAAGVPEPRIQALLAWRRSALLVVLPVLLLSLGLSVADAASLDTEGMTGFGKFWNWLPPIGLAFMPLGVLHVSRRWTQLRGPARTLVWCWVASIAIPLLAAVIPLEAILDVEALRMQMSSDEELLQLQAVIFSTRLAMAVGYALTLLPVIISVPAGVLKGAGRVKSLFPAASLPGWFLVSVAPFYSLFMVVVFVLIDQIVGNWLLLLGVALLAFAPWLFVIHRKIYARPLSLAEAHEALPRATRTSRWVVLGGAVIVAGYLLTAQVNGMDVLGSNEDTAVFTYLQIARSSVEVVGRSLVTSVVFCMILLTMMFAEWRVAQQLPDDVRAEHEQQMQSFRRFVEP